MDSAAGRKRQEIELRTVYFFVHICYMFSVSKCRGESDLGLCMTSAHTKRMPLRSGAFRCKHVFGRKIHQKSPLRSGILYVCPEVMHTPRSDSPLHSRFRYGQGVAKTLAWKLCVCFENTMLAFGVCFRQACSSAGRRIAAVRSRLDYYRALGLFPSCWMECFVNYSFRPNPTQPYLNVEQIIISATLANTL